MYGMVCMVSIMKQEFRRIKSGHSVPYIDNLVQLVTRRIWESRETQILRVWDRRCLDCLEVFVFWFLELTKCLCLLFLVRIKSWYTVMRIRVKKLVSAISRKLVFGWKICFGGIGGLKMFLKWSQMVPPHPHPRRQQKSPARGKQIKPKQMFDEIHHLI